MNLCKCIFVNCDCYKAGKTIKPQGIMVHSTGANNPTLRRYVQPDDGKLGKNNNGNDWNRSGINACVHAFIGKLQDGTIATYQTLPWDHRGWHAGGAANNTHISFEICEDDLSDVSYFYTAYKEAVDLCVHLCKLYGLNEKDIICHSEGAQCGIASNHADVMHWFPRQGKSMDTFRADVAEQLKEEEEMTQEQFNQMMDKYLDDRAKQPPSEWSKEAREAAEAKGLIVGDETGNKQYKSFVTREQLVTILERL